MKKLDIKKPKINIIGNKKILSLIKFVLIIAMLILIYILSPKITSNIQYMAKYLYELDSIYITRVVELILCTSCILAILIIKNDKK